MKQYEIVIPKHIQKHILKLPKLEQQRLDKIINYLKYDPYPPASIKLVNQPGYRIRFGDYRIIYEVENEQLTILVLKVSHRKDVYKNWTAL